MHLTARLVTYYLFFALIAHNKVAVPPTFYPLEAEGAVLRRCRLFLDRRVRIHPYPPLPAAVFSCSVFRVALKRMLKLLSPMMTLLNVPNAGLWTHLTPRKDTSSVRSLRVCVPSLPVNLLILKSTSLPRPIPDRGGGKDSSALDSSRRLGMRIRPKWPIRQHP